MAEWGISAPTIMREWTEEYFYLMVDKLIERKEREADAARGVNTISYEEFISQSGMTPQRIEG